MPTAIHLPVLKRLVVRDYPLYPGKEGRGLDLALDDGMTVLVGVNGVGKTTFLNLLLRMLIGPAEPQKGNQELGRVSKRQLVLPQKASYFADRVPW